MPTEDAELLELDIEELVLDAATRDLIATCEAELATDPDRLRAARLHCEIGLAYEAAGHADSAVKHYEQALAGAPDHLPAIRGARCAFLTRGDYEAALTMLDAEERLTSSPARKARLLMVKGHLLDDRVGDPRRARDAYARALELDPGNASVLRALERGDRRAGQLEMVLHTLDRAAAVVADDPPYRAALLAMRAYLVERRGEGPGPGAAELYEAALKLDPQVAGAASAAERIYRRDSAWRDLAAALERDAGQATSDARRAVALYQLGRVRADRLGDQGEAIAALTSAAAASPGDPLVLEDLARAHEQARDYESLAGVLVQLVAGATDTREKVALQHRLGQVFEGALRDPAAAIVRYTEAIAIDPTYVPVLQALGRLLAAREQWPDLIKMHLAEAGATRVAARAAAAHARVAEIYENQLREPAQAALHHARALTLVPGYPASFKALGRLYTVLDRHRDHVELLERAVAEGRQPALVVAYLYKIGSLWEEFLDDPAQALHAYRRILDLTPGDLLAIHAIQRVAERAGRYQVLVEALEREIGLVEDPKLKVGLLHRVGTVFDDHLRDQDAALARFRGALEIDPAFVPALASVGRIYYRAGRWSDLLDVYAREVEATPSGTESVELLHKMGELCEDKLGDLDAAVAWYQRAVELDPSYRPAIRALVRRLRERGDWAALARTLELEVGRQVDAGARAVTWYRIGQVHEAWLADADGAVKAYREALANHPGYRPAEDALARLHEERGEWAPLIAVLAQRADATDDAGEWASAALRQGQIYRDELRDPVRAIACFEAVVERGVSSIPALLALEALYDDAKNIAKLIDVNAALAAAVTDTGAKIAAHRELARLRELHGLGTPEELAATYEAILALDPRDEPALAALEQLARMTRNDRVLAQTYGRLSESTDNPALAARFLTGLGRALERLGDRRAVVAYDAAVQRDPGALAAIRGLARAADAGGDADASARALRLEAELTRRPEVAAALYVRIGSVPDLERALEVWPDDADAAAALVPLLVEANQVERLIDVLAKAAQSAKQADRRGALWLAVGGLYIDRTDNMGAGITALKRALDAMPGDASTLARLAGAYQKNSQWDDAIGVLEQALAGTTADAEARATLQLALAGIYADHVGNVDKATEYVQAVLAVTPDHPGALARLVEIQLRGDPETAIATLTRLVELADTPAAKAEALVRLARVVRTTDAARADQALVEGVALTGSGGAAASELKTAIAKHGNWVGYAAGLDSYLKHTKRSPELAGTYLELAGTYADGMKLPNRAIETLADGIEACGEQPALVIALAQRLTDSGRADEALKLIKHAVGKDALRPELWKLLASIYNTAKRPDDARRAFAVAAVVGEAGDRSGSAAAGRGNPAAAGEKSFDAEVMTALSVDGVDASPITSVLAAVVEPIARRSAPSLERYGLSPRDRVTAKSNPALFEPKQQIAAIFGIEFELFEHDLAEPALAIEPFEEPAVLVSHTVSALPHSQQVFVLAYAGALIATRLHAALALHPAELEATLVGAVRTVAPGFSVKGKGGEDAEEIRETVRKYHQRRWRKQLETSAEEVVALGAVDVAGWRWQAQQWAVRTAAVLADDLGASIDALRWVIDLPLARGRALVEASPAVRDLLRFWVSNRAAQVRAQTGIVGGG